MDEDESHENTGGLLHGANGVLADFFIEKTNPIQSDVSNWSGWSRGGVYVATWSFSNLSRNNKAPIEDFLVGFCCCFFLHIRGHGSKLVYSNCAGRHFDGPGVQLLRNGGMRANPAKYFLPNGSSLA